MFGGFDVVLRSKRGVVVSRLEGNVCVNAPNLGNFSRVWRVLGCVLLQTWGIFHAFGALKRLILRILLSIFVLL